MSTTVLHHRRSLIQRLIDSSIDENLPRRYKRTVFISTLIFLLSDNSYISEKTFKKIVALFEMGIQNEKNLKYGYYFKNYVWKQLINHSEIDFKGQNYNTVQLVKLYKSNKVVFDLSDLEAVIENIFNMVPSYLKYGSDRLLKYDICNIIQFIKNKNLVV